MCQSKLDAKSFWLSDTKSGSKSNLRRSNTWEVANPITQTTSTTPHLTVLKIKSILATVTSKRLTHTSLIRSLPAGVTGLQLEAIPDERLPKGVPGAVYYEGPIGDFFLSEVTYPNDQVQKISEASHSTPVVEILRPSALTATSSQAGRLMGGQRRRHVAVL